jgi:hypothetical protein
MHFFCNRNKTEVTNTSLNSVPGIEWAECEADHSHRSSAQLTMNDALPPFPPYMCPGHAHGLCQ